MRRVMRATMGEGDGAKLGGEGTRVRTDADAGVRRLPEP